MLAHLWTGAPAPKEYLMALLCDRFKCMQSELRAQAASDVLEMLVCLDAEAEVRMTMGRLRGR